ncbi:MAG: hypothetical protein GXP63_05655 [DPANN group archaeon]|nr:hypothetical protein [DPANN group archaeon]
MRLKKQVSLFFLALVLVNFGLFIFNRIEPLVFWIITALAAAVVYVLLPRLPE